MAKVIVSIQHERINLQFEERISKNLFSSFRHEGWLWSRSQDAFVFNVNEQGARRVSRIENKSICTPYHLSPEEKDELIAEIEALNVEYATADDEQKIRSLQQSHAEKLKAEKAILEAKKAQADKNRTDRAMKIIEQMNVLKNGFGANSWDLATSNYNLSDLLARSGVRVDYSVKDLASRFGYEDADRLISDDDILEFSIRYGNNWKRYSDKVESRYLSFEVDHFKKSTVGDFMSGGSGHFSLQKTLLDNQSRINFKNVVKVSELVDDEILKVCFDLYIGYLKGEITPMRTINCFGGISSDEIKTDRLDVLANRFAGVAA